MSTSIKNEKAKREYRRWLKDARGYTDSTVDKMLNAICYYERVMNYEDFALYNRVKAVAFKDSLKRKTFNGRQIGPNSIRSYLIHVKSFFTWLFTQPGYKSRIYSTELDYLNSSKKEVMIAAHVNPRTFPDIDYVRKLVNSINQSTIIDKRDRAIISFLFLTGMRDSAVISLPLKCIDMENLFIDQNPKLGVKTKFSKNICSKIFNFDDELLKNVVDWIKLLYEKGFTPDDPVFPRSKEEMIENGYSFIEARDVEPKFWSTTNSIRTIIKNRAAKAGLIYFPPHTFRHSAISYAFNLAQSGDEIKAISQNFGHENISTTLSSYANYSQPDLKSVLKNLGKNKSTLDFLNDSRITKMIEKMYEHIVKQ